MKLLLLPLSWIYSAIIHLRNYLYDQRVLRSVRFDIPVISIGNLSVGGTGKTPHTEYLIRLLQYHYRVGTLSRGYGRLTHGFLLASGDTDATHIGDEPLLYKVKYPDTTVAVAEDRVVAIPRMLHEQPDIEVILLDDAYQHRAVRAGLSILLTRYDALFTRDYVLPAGWLREARAGYHRADILIVTKCPPDLPQVEMDRLTTEIHPYPYQHIYYTTIHYGSLYPLIREQLQQHDIPTMNVDIEILLITAIADPTPLVAHYKVLGVTVHTLAYRDHHLYDLYDLENIRESFSHLPNPNKAIVTTEKDATKLWLHRAWFLQNNIPIFVQPMEVHILGDKAPLFERDILRYVSITHLSTQYTAPTIHESNP